MKEFWKVFGLMLLSLLLSGIMATFWIGIFALAFFYPWIGVPVCVVVLVSITASLAWWESSLIRKRNEKQNKI
jgi:membrane protein implicated in regulation of membrane protease activity